MSWRRRITRTSIVKIKLDFCTPWIFVLMNILDRYHHGFPRTLPISDCVRLPIGQNRKHITSTVSFTVQPLFHDRHLVYGIFRSEINAPDAIESNEYIVGGGCFQLNHDGQIVGVVPVVGNSNNILCIELCLLRVPFVFWTTIQDIMRFAAEFSVMSRYME